MSTFVRTVLLATLVAWTIASASPVRGAINSIPRQKNNAVQCHKASQYSAEWFLQNTRLEYAQPLIDNALFYSAGMSENARRIAAEQGKTTIWDVWPCYLYNHLQKDTNPLRCIHADDKERDLFFRHMSRAFAMKARKSATVLHSDKNYKSPPTKGIWGSVEFPVLQRSGVVDLLHKINENMSQPEVFWERSKAIVADFWHWGDLKKRVGEKRVAGPPPLPTDFEEVCLSRRELSFFENVAW